MSKLNLDSWMCCSFSSSCAEAMWLTGREPAQESMMAFRPQKSHQPASSCHALSQGHAHTQTSPAKKLGLSRRVYVSLFSLSAAAISISAPLSPWANLWSHLELFQKKPVLQTDERIHTHTVEKQKSSLANKKLLDLGLTVGGRPQHFLCHLDCTGAYLSFVLDCGLRQLQADCCSTAGCRSSR